MDGTVQTFGSYQLIEKIATGGMAEVYRAQTEGAMGFTKTLVIKRILDSLAEDEEFRELFTTEARIAAMLSHVNIVQVFELGQVGESLFIAMEYVHGQDMARLVSRARPLGDFPVALALFVTGEVLKALQFAHEFCDSEGTPLNIVHCDISPQNILVSFAGEAKITDFGISRVAFQKGNQDVIRGKYAYMSPEQVEGRPLDGRSDLFSVGTVLYEWLTGRRLFKAKTRDETLARVRRAEVPSLRAARPEISAELEDFVLRTLARDPANRWADAGQMMEALSGLMVREGHRVTNNDLASFVHEVMASSGAPVAPDGPAGARVSRPVRPANTTPLVVMAVEASAPPRGFSGPRQSLSNLSLEWAGLLSAAGGEVWEQGEGAALAVWSTPDRLSDAVSQAVNACIALQRSAAQAGFRVAAGICPGVARLQADSGRPAEGWELAGPFYLARWMMNLSAHRGRILITEVGASQIQEATTPLGRIPIQGNKFINLHELG